MSEATELAELIQEFGDEMRTQLSAVRAEVRTERGHREELERKTNMLKVSGGGSGREVADAVESFERSVKSYYPARADVRIDATAFSDYRSAFERFIRGGERILSAEEVKAMQVGVDPEGGYLVPPGNLSNQIIRLVTARSVVRRLAYVMPISLGEVELPAETSELEAEWVSETSERGVTDAGDLGLVHVIAKEMQAQPEVTQRLLDDAVIDVEAYLGDKIGRRFARAEDKAFINGLGISNPHGFCAYPTSATSDAAGTRPLGTLEHVATGVSGDWPAADEDVYDLLVDVTQALNPDYRNNASWIMGTEAVTKLMKLKDGDKNPYWQRSMAAGVPPTLLGYPVYETSWMPAIAADSLSVAFGDFREGYLIVDRLGIRMLRDPYTHKGWIRYYTTRRVGGGVRDSQAIKLIKFAAS